ncbi:MAG: adenylyl-sulfate kinase [Candidatus Omnitrophica bacterium]|nr:adenylyl-sulfate kinase [Candidatus Omnitrophota bacterium]
MGSLFWITGLSGAGKTTIAGELYKILQKKESNVILLDGDELRKIFGVSGAYSAEERLNLALQYSRLCKFLTEQDIDVVCGTLSMFHVCHRWNRENIAQYREIYLKVPMEVLRKRDPKRIYSRAEKGELKNVMGIDIPFEEPQNPDMIINNDGGQSPDILARSIYERFFETTQEFSIGELTA